MIFAAFLEGLHWQTIQSNLAAVRNLHIRAGVSFPGQDEAQPQLQLMLRGIRRVASQRHRTSPSLPITPSILRWVQDTLSSYRKQQEIDRCIG